MLIKAAPHPQANSRLSNALKAFHGCLLPLLPFVETALDILKLMGAPSWTVINCQQQRQEAMTLTLGIEYIVS